MMLGRFIGAVLIYFSVASAAPAKLWLDNFSALFWSSSLVTPNGKWLYVDGGEIWDGPSNSDGTGYVLQSTFVFDLSKSFDDWSLSPIKTVTKPLDFPMGRYPMIWYSSKDDTIYSFGGQDYIDHNCPSKDCKTWKFGGNSPDYFSTLKEPSINTPQWQLSVDENGLPAGSWTASPPDAQPRGITPPPFSSLYASSPSGDLWSLSGTSSFEGDQTQTLPGMTRFNGTWTNTTITPSQYTTFGQAIFVPSFGEQGIIINLGGYLSSDPYTQYLFADPHYLRSMSDVSIYDVASETFYTQSVSGSAPPSRHAFCAVGVADETGNFDIFIYGGAGAGGNAINDISVLSLPSFRWTRITDKDAKASARQQHTCQLIGNRQMVSIGGADGLRSHGFDPFGTGFGFFDLSSLTWTDGYNPRALPYTRSSLVAQSLKGNTYPSQWNSPELAKIFGGSSKPSSSSSPPTSSPSSSPSSSSSSLSGGAIAGTVIGVLALVVIVGIAIVYFKRRNTRPLQKDVPPESPASKSDDQSDSCQDEIDDKPSVLPKSELPAGSSRNRNSAPGYWADIKNHRQNSSREEHPAVRPTPELPGYSSSDKQHSKYYLQEKELPVPPKSELPGDTQHPELEGSPPPELPASSPNDFGSDDGTMVNKSSRNHSKTDGYTTSASRSPISPIGR